MKASSDIAMRELRIPGKPAEQKKATLTIDSDLAIIVRKIAATEGRSRDLTSVVGDMVRAYIAKEHPGWKMLDGVDKKQKPRSE